MKAFLFILVGSFLVSGCAPLEQAPLLYTSTVTFGASTGVNTKETPGFDVVIGYKQVDAAYVPVAVAKEGDGDSQVYQIHPIQAVNSDMSLKRTQASDVQLEDLKNKQNAISQLNTKKENRISLLAEKKKQLEEKQANKNTYQVEFESATQERKLELQGLIDKLDEDIAAIDVEQKQLQNETDSINKELLTAETDLKVLKNELGMTNETNGNDSKYDAYSVYGSFDSKTTVLGGANASSDTGLGKVFSTGVAAQILAEGERDKVSKSHVTSCLNHLSELSKKHSITLTPDVLMLCKNEPVPKEKQPNS